MKVEVLQENLNKAVSSVVRVVASRPQVPILGNILLSARGGELVLTASNMEITMIVEVGAKVLEEGEYTVPGRTFSEIIGSLSAEKIVLEHNDGALIVKAGKFSGKINGVVADEFVKIQEIKDEEQNKLTIGVKELTEAISKTVISTALDESRAVLTGVVFKGTNEGLVMAATDGFRLSVVKAVGKINGVVIIPAKTLAEVLRVLGEGNNKIDILFAGDGTQVLFDLGNIKIYSRLISGNFPDFEKIIPANFAVRAVINVEELSKAVKLAAVFARDSANIVKFSVRSSELVVRANAAETGENETVLEVVSEKDSGEEITIAFNYRYLVDFLNVCNGSEVTLELNGPLAPGLFRVKGQENYLHIIMPVRVQG